MAPALTAEQPSVSNVPLDVVVLMLLDTRTLIVSTALVTAVHGFVAILFAYQHRGTRALKQVGCGTLICALSLAGVGLRGWIPDLLPVVLSSVLLPLALLCVDNAVRVYTQVPRRDPVGWALVALTFVGQLVIYCATPDVRGRIILLSAVTAYLLGRMAVTLHWNAPPDGRRAYRFAEGLCGLWTLVQVARIIGTVLSPPIYDILAPGPIQMVTFPIAMALSVFLMLGFVGIELFWLNHDLVRLATRDSLTGALNRASFLAAGREELSRCERQGGAFSIVLFDVDHFKQINDQYGHAAGDAVLIELVRTLSRSLRGYDHLARLGGEEFAVLLPELDGSSAARVAERARQSLNAAAVEVNGETLRMRVSGGISSYPADGRTITDLLNAADAVLYRAKEAGRNRIEQTGEQPSLTG